MHNNFAVFPFSISLFSIFFPLLLLPRYSLFQFVWWMPVPQFDWNIIISISFWGKWKWEVSHRWWFDWKTQKKTPTESRFEDNFHPFFSLHFLAFCIHSTSDWSMSPFISRWKLTSNLAESSKELLMCHSDECRMSEKILLNATAPPSSTHSTPLPHSTEQTW